MSIIQKRGKEVTKELRRKNFIDGRRDAVDDGWARYVLEVFDREDAGASREESWRHGYEELNRQTDAFVRREAERWARQCRHLRIYEDDFESHFRTTVWRASLRYDGQRGSFFDYLRTSIQNTARDLIRHAKTRKNQINHMAKRLDDEKVMTEVNEVYQMRSAEDEAMASLIIEDMLADESLTDQERSVFNMMRQDPEITLQSMADELGTNRMQVSRIRNRMAEKLRKYYE